MTVADLIEKLKDFDPEAEVVLSDDYAEMPRTYLYPPEVNRHGEVEL